MIIAFYAFNKEDFIILITLNLQQKSSYKGNFPDLFLVLNSI